jgi:phosphate starvation-inducible PhoH-like protein
MEQYFAPAAQQSSHEITSLGSSGELFLDRYNDLISATQRAVLPFHFHIASSARGLCLDGDPIAVTIAAKVIEQVVRDKAERTTLDATGLKATVSGTVAKALKTDLTFHLKGLSHTLTPMSLSQAAFMQSLLLPGEQLTIGVGPTGTGKTHLAIAAALNQLSEEHVKRVVITRPHVVMDGETTTAAPIQDLEYDTQFEFFEDILHDLLNHQAVAQLREQRKLELIPLGRMRGRTFNNTFIILDEAQNMTVPKMRMALTRTGRGSSMVVTGNVDHVDLSENKPSGLIHLLGLLQGSDIARIHRFEADHIIRSDLVSRLEQLYSGRRPSADQQRDVTSPSVQPYDAIVHA